MRNIVFISPSHQCVSPVNNLSNAFIFVSIPANAVHRFIGIIVSRTVFFDVLPVWFGLCLFDKNLDLFIYLPQCWDMRRFHSSHRVVVSSDSALQDDEYGRILSLSSVPCVSSTRPSEGCCNVFTLKNCFQEFSRTEARVEEEFRIAGLSSHSRQCFVPQCHFLSVISSTMSFTNWYISEVCSCATAKWFVLRLQFIS